MKLRCIWFPAEPSVANDPGAERRGGGKGAVVFAAAQRTLAAEHRSATWHPMTDGAVGNQMPGFPGVGSRSSSWLLRQSEVGEGLEHPFVFQRPGNDPQELPRKCDGRFSGPP